MDYPLIAALINCTYHKLIGCTPFYYLYRRDPWASTLLPLAYWATAKPLLNISDAEFNYKDLDSNKEILGPQLDENGNRREAAEQEHKAEDNQSITFSVLTAANKAHNMSSNIEDNNN